MRRNFNASLSSTATSPIMSADSSRMVRRPSWRTLRTTVKNFIWLKIGENYFLFPQGGLKLSYRNYKKFLAKNEPMLKLPELNLTLEQTFWVKNAQIWCARYDKGRNAEFIINQSIRFHFSLQKAQSIRSRTSHTRYRSSESTAQCRT